MHVACGDQLRLNMQYSPECFCDRVTLAARRCALASETHYRVHLMPSRRSFAFGKDIPRRDLPLIEQRQRQGARAEELRAERAEPCEGARLHAAFEALTRWLTY